MNIEPEDESEIQVNQTMNLKMMHAGSMILSAISILMEKTTGL
jgi:hypothetical protein